MNDENPVQKTILVLSANPQGTRPLRLDEEIREIKEGLKLARQRDKFKIESTEAARYRDIQRSILSHNPHIVHFSGHGAGEAGLVFEDNSGQQKLVDAPALADFFELFADKVECVVLNACYSEIQAEAIAQHINYVIGMSKEIGDKAAIEFAVGFYDALGDGRQFEFAYKYGCSAIRMAGIPEHLTPQLLKKEDFCGQNIDSAPVATSTPQDARKTTIISPSPTPTSPTTPLVPTQEETEYELQQEAERLREEQEQEQQRLKYQRQQEHENNLKRYEQQLSIALTAKYPLDDYVSNELKNFQQSLGLTNEDIAPIEQRLFAPKEAEYERQQQEAERLKQEEQERRQQELQRQQESVSTPPKSPSIIQTQPFEFETATLGQNLQINRSRGQAEYFKEDLGNGVFLEMVKIPGGNFLMGSPKDELRRSDDEGPQHKVNIQPFFMGKFQVTQEQYQAIMGENPSRFQGRKKPVEKISWDKAVEFCARISDKSEKIYRLPSEAEWEYACRAGTTTPFYFGETITTELVNYDGNYTYGSAPKGQYRQQTTDVGSFPGNAFGLYDMHGNVYEWCQDGWHENYNGAPTDGSAWINNKNKNYIKCVLRGGSWTFNPDLCRSAYRNYNDPGIVNLNIGLRVVCGVAPRTL